MFEGPVELRVALVNVRVMLMAERGLRPELDRVLSVAQRSVPGCNAGSITLVAEGRPQTEAAIDRVVVAVDLAHYEIQQGSCLVAAAENGPIRVDLVPVEERVPRFADRAGHTGVQSSLSLPVVVDGDVVGSLDLYSRTPPSFDATFQDLGAMLTTQVGVAVAKSRLVAGSRQVAAAAQRFVDDKADVAVAQGMLMVLERCSSDQAASLLRNAASSEAETLVVIARRVIAEVQSHAGRPTPPSDPASEAES